MLATFTNVDFQRTRFWCLAGAIATNFPRRIGDATPQELVRDKRLSRKVCHNYRTLWDLFHRESEVPPPPEWNNWPVIVNDPIMLRVGATVIWDRQVDYLLDVVLMRMERLTEFEELAIADGMRTWYAKHAMLLDWEMEALHRIKNFINTGSNVIPKEE
jgi:hypothetical protein